MKSYRSDVNIKLDAWLTDTFSFETSISFHELIV